MNPVIQNLLTKKIPVKILVMGTSRKILKDCSHCLDIQKDCGTKEIVDGETWDRFASLTLEDVGKVVECFSSPQTLVLGVASKVQAQLSWALKKDKKHIIAYYEAFSPPETHSVVGRHPFFANEFWVPLDSIVKDFEKLIKIPIKVVGQPSLETWAQESKFFKTEDIYFEIPQLKKESFKVLFAGGYGEGYEDSFRLFAQTSERLGDFQFLLSPHPKTDGTLEKNILKELPGNKLVIVPQRIGTMKAAFVSNVVVSQNSTVGLQALALNKAVIYLDHPKFGYTNFAIQRNLAKKVFSIEQLMQELVEIKKSPTMGYSDFSGMPKDSTEFISTHLIKLQKANVRK